MNKKFSSTILATIMSIMLVVTMIPPAAFVVHADSSSAPRENIVDNSTINEWEDYFLDLADKGTEYAGGVWTDKSVFKSGADFANEANELKGSDPDNKKQAIKNKLSSAIGTNNFLVSMSALATNKEIVGYSTVPTDTIFVIDVSQSMDNSKSIPDTVDAANDAIKRLLELNHNNRVGVVLYSGNSQTGDSNSSHGLVLLGLDRYKAGANGKYISYTNSANNSNSAHDTTVKIADNLKYEKNNADVPKNGKSKKTIGGTYIQNGLLLAYGEFKNAKTTVDANNFQSGEKRMPIYVLMSDGAPTAGTPSYTTGGNTSIGDGTATSTTLGFVTQLTAAYVREQTEKHYDNQAKFYTLGLNLSDGDGEAIASSVLNPTQSVDAINTYWDNLFKDGEVSVGGNKKVVKSSDGPTERTDQKYVDKYFRANGGTSLRDAFGDIVSEIILQSAYYPTHIEENGRNLSGYVSFYDEIGHHMEVKEIEGILLGDHLFTGETIAHMIQDGGFGNASINNENGWELVESVAERIGVDESTAISLLQNAWHDGQLYYNSANDYSNYIGWYENTDGGFVAAWDKEDGEDAIQAAKDKGAKYITKSYGYYGETSNVSTFTGIFGGDMMHVIVKVRTDIDTNLQEVIFEIPASLIPVITYNITLQGQNYDAAEGNPMGMTVTEASPIRLLFEVGLRDDVNELTVAELMAQSGAHKHPVKGANGNPTGDYYFYTNIWNQGTIPTDPKTHAVAESQFTPSLDNERYYYVEDSPIYVEEGSTYTLHTGAKPEATDSTQYFIKYRAFTKDNSGKVDMKYIFEEMHEDIAASSIAKNTDGSWYVKKGTVRKSLPSYEIEKDKENSSPGNLTKTLRYSRYVVIESNDLINDAKDYTIYSYLGNNGRTKLTPATGIKLTKEVNNTLTASNEEYKFIVDLPVGTYTLTKGGVTSTITIVAQNASRGTYTVALKAGETAYITGLASGAAYSVKEVIEGLPGYKVKNISVNGAAVTYNTSEPDANSTGQQTVENKKISNVVFTNEAADVRTTHVINGTKVLNGGKNIGSGDFEFVLYSKESSSGQETEISRVSSSLAFANNEGKATSAFEFPAIEHRAAGTHHYVIKEINKGAPGYDYDDTVYNITVTVTEGSNVLKVEESITKTKNGTTTAAANVIFNNSYEPAAVDLQMKANKVLENRSLKADEFQFSVYPADDSFATNNAAALITARNDANGNVVFEPISITKAGIYYYVIKEDIPDDDDRDQDVVYDSSEYQVKVTAFDDNGELRLHTEYKLNGEPVENVTFYNVYFEPEPPSPEDPEDPPVGPEEPTDPTDPKKPSDDSKKPKDKVVDSGDYFKILPFALMAIVALGGAAAVLFRRKK